MNEQLRRRRTIRRVLIALLVLALLVLAGAAAMMIPILTHQSAGGSGQSVPKGFVSETEAVGADGRTRVLTVETEDGAPADLADLTEGDVLVVRGSGYDPGIGIYVSICIVPSVPGERPSPCLGGIPEGAMDGDESGSQVEGSDTDSAAEAEPGASAWITDDWAWRAFATQGYDDAEHGAFEVRLVVPPASQEGLDCTKLLCAITTRADHTASSDRVQDMQLPVAFAG